MRSKKEQKPLTPEEEAALKEKRARAQEKRQKKRRDEMSVERAYKALEMRKQGMSWDMVAKKLGYESVTSVKDLAYRWMKKVVLEDIEEMKLLEDQRLDALFASTYPLAIDGDLQAVNACLKIMDRRASLRGLDAPKRLETTNQTTQLKLVEIRMPQLDHQGKPLAELAGEATKLLEGQAREAGAKDEGVEGSALDGEVIDADFREAAAEAVGD